MLARGVKSTLVHAPRHCRMYLFAAGTGCRRRGRHRSCGFVLEIAKRRGIGEGEPAGGGDIGWIVERVDLVFASQSVRHHVELQLPDRAEQQRIVPRAFEDLDRPFLAQLLETFLKLLGLEGVSRGPRNAEQFGGSREPLTTGFPSVACADLQLA